MARVVEDLECVMWNSIDTSQHCTTERVVDETVIVSARDLEECGCCHKSRVFFGRWVERRFATASRCTGAAAASASATARRTAR